MLPSLQCLLRILKQSLLPESCQPTFPPMFTRGESYSLQSRIRRVSVRLKHIADIEGRDPVHGPAVSPAEGRFQAAAVERTAGGARFDISNCIYCGNYGGRLTRLEIL